MVKPDAAMQNNLGTVTEKGKAQDGRAGASSVEEQSKEVVGSVSDVVSEYGPDLWLIQRRKWLNGTLYPDQTPVSSSSSTNTTTSSSTTTTLINTLEPSPKPKPQPLLNLSRLSSLLSHPSTPDSSSAWTTGGLSKIHQNLMDGKTLKNGLKLSGVIVILRAGWVRDGTWPSVNVPGVAASGSAVGVGSSGSSRLTLENGSSLGLGSGITGTGGKKSARRKAVLAMDDPFFATPPVGAIVSERDGLEVWTMPGEEGTAGKMIAER